MLKQKKINDYFGIKASSLDVEKLPYHKKPAQIRDEIPTLNQYGYMKFELDEFGIDFLHYASKSEKPSLEIGTAYGFITHEALKRDIKIIANDISKEHLEVLLRDAPKDKLDNLYINNSRFPNEIDLPNDSIGVVLASRILHFLDVVELEQGLEKIYNWLTPGGKFICSNCSIYHYSIKDKLSEIFRKNEKNGVKYPSRIVNQREVAPLHKSFVQDFFHPFDIPVLTRLLTEFNFKINKIKLFDYPSDIYSKDNEGHVGFVATKL